MNIKRRDFIRAGGMLAIAGGAAVADAAGVPAEAPAGAVRFSQDVPVLIFQADNKAVRIVSGRKREEERRPFRSNGKAFFREFHFYT